MIYVYPKLSNFDFYIVRFFGPGLANLLFPWAKAIVFAKNYELKPIFPCFRQIKIGTILRWETDTRWYFSLFKPTQLYVDPLSKYFLLSTRKKITQKQFLEKFPKIDEGTIVVIEGMEDYFSQFLNEYEFVRTQLLSITREKHLKGLSFDFSKSITLHIRLGDFQPPTEEKLRSGEFVRMPISWYKDFIEQVRAEVGYKVQCYIFTNGQPDEVSELLKLGNIEILSFGSSIADLLAMSRARLFVSSASTYAMWASFLGRMPTIYFPGQVKQSLYFDKPEYEIEWEKGKKLPLEVIEQALK